MSATFSSKVCNPSTCTWTSESNAYTFSTYNMMCLNYITALTTKKSFSFKRHQWIIITLLWFQIFQPFKLPLTVTQTTHAQVPTYTMMGLRNHVSAKKEKTSVSHYHTDRYQTFKLTSFLVVYFSFSPIFKFHFPSLSLLLNFSFFFPCISSHSSIIDISIIHHYTWTV